MKQGAPYMSTDRRRHSHDGQHYDEITVIRQPPEDLGRRPGTTVARDWAVPAGAHYEVRVGWVGPDKATGHRRLAYLTLHTRPSDSTLRDTRDWRQIGEVEISADTVRGLRAALDELLNVFNADERARLKAQATCSPRGAQTRG